MTKALFFSLAALVSLPGVASAQAIIIGGGLAKDCYDRVRDNDGRAAEIERVCTNALQQETMTSVNRAATYVNRGIIQMRNGDHDNAMKDYDRALQIDEDLGAAYLNKGAALIFQKKFDDAIAPLDKAIDLSTHDLHAAHYNRAIARENSGDVAGAYRDFQKALELQPEWDLAQRQLERFSVTGN